MDYLEIKERRSTGQGYSTWIQRAQKAKSCQGESNPASPAFQQTSVPVLGPVYGVVSYSFLQHGKLSSRLRSREILLTPCSLKVFAAMNAMGKSSYSLFMSVAYLLQSLVLTVCRRWKLVETWLVGSLISPLLIGSTEYVYFSLPSLSSRWGVVWSSIDSFWYCKSTVLYMVVKKTAIPGSEARWVSLHALDRYSVGRT